MRHKHTPLLVGAITALGLSACGARLSPAQRATYDAAYGLSGPPHATGPLATDATALPVSSRLPTTTATNAEVAPVLPSTAPLAVGGAPTPATAATRPPSARATTATRSKQVAPARTSFGLDSTTGSISIDPAICTKPATGPGISANAITLGNVSTLTGPIPGLFLGAVHGVQAFATYINSLGGICGRQLIVKSGDDNLQASQNAAATQQLSSQVFAFVGSFSADDDGGAAVLKANGIPDAGQALSKDRFDLPNNFSPEPIAGWNEAPYMLMKKLYPDAAAHMAIMGANQPTGHEAYVNQKQAMLNAGMKIVYDDPNIEPTQTDYSSDAQAMKSAGAQGLVWGATAGTMASTAKAIQNAGINPFPLGSYGTTAYDQQFLQQAGSAAEGALIYLPEAMYQGEDSNAVPMVATFNKWYQALYHQTPDEFAMYSWMSSVLFIQGLNAGGALNQKALLTGLKSITTFDAGGMVAPDNPAAKKPPQCYILIDVKNGKFVRDPSDPPTGFNCEFTPSYYYAPN